MKKKIVLAICTLMIAIGGIGMNPILHTEKPVSKELLAEAVALKEKEKTAEEEKEIKPCEEGCTLEEGHEGSCVVKEDEEIVEVILKSTSLERD